MKINYSPPAKHTSASEFPAAGTFRAERCAASYTSDMRCQQYVAVVCRLFNDAFSVYQTIQRQQYVAVNPSKPEAHLNNI
jgi:hypothetical protein